MIIIHSCTSILLDVPTEYELIFLLDEAREQREREGNKSKQYGFDGKGKK